ncbi:MAG: hypothetical protein JJ879_14410 [Sneathiella sp.]|nr:hypothetical protein [Sneathiella sp.]
MRAIQKTKFIISACLMLLLSACVTTPERPTYADITFQHLAPLRLDVGEIKIVNEYRSPLTAPNVEHELPVKIEDSLRNWVRDRIQVTGNQNAFAVFTIKDASVIEKPLEKKSGLSGLFTTDQSERYEFRVAAEVMVQEVNGNKAIATADSSRIKSVSEDITLNDREMVYFEQTEIMMREFDVQMEKNIRQFLGGFLR